jgi:UDP-3-O-[3-hydroxymyristoyl] glucosamine N-acyltransferase
MKISELAAHLGAHLDAASAADSQVDIVDVRGIEAAGPGEVTFIANPKYASAARSTKASAVLVPEAFAGLPRPGTCALRTANPYLAFARAIECFHATPRYAPGIHPTAVIDPAARLGANAHVGPYVVVGANAVIGDDCALLAHVVIYPGVRIGHRFFAHAHAVVRENCRLGDGVILQNGAIIGADGFGFARDAERGWYKILQSGIAVLEQDVEVQANACVDRASIGETRVGRDAKIDNLVQVGHGSTVGEHSLLCAQVGLAGSTHVGKNVILAGQVGVAGHCHVGDGVVAIAQSGIPGDVKPGSTISGSPAIDHAQWMRAVAVFARLPEFARTLRDLQKKLAQKP